jgi:hypothetical protein
VAELSSWDICRLFVTIRENISTLKSGIVAYGYEEAELKLQEVEGRLYGVELDVEAFFAPDWNDCKKLQDSKNLRRAETPVQRETEDA